MSPFLLIPLSLSLVQAGAVFLRLCAKNCNSAEEHHGCLVKEQRVVIGGSRLNHRSHLSVEQCAKFCADRSDCDAFHVERKVCRLYWKGIIEASAIPSSTAGFCPKGLWLTYIFKLQLLT